MRQTLQAISSYNRRSSKRIKIPGPLSFHPQTRHCSAYYIMEHIEGSCYADPSLPGVEPSVRRKMYAGAVSALAELHNARIEAVGSGGRGAPRREGGTVASWLLKKASAEQDAITGEIPGRAELESSLARTSPRRIRDRALPGLTMTHGDYKMDNIVFTREGEVAGIIDWELSKARGDPLEDVGNFCVWHDVESRLGNGVYGLRGLPPGALAGVPTKGEVISLYLSLTSCSPRIGRCVSLWYGGWTMYKNSVIAQGVYCRYVAARGRGEGTGKKGGGRDGKGNNDGMYMAVAKEAVRIGRRLLEEYERGENMSKL